MSLQSHGEEGTGCCWNVALAAESILMFSLVLTSDGALGCGCCAGMGTVCPRDVELSGLAMRSGTALGAPALCGAVETRLWARSQAASARHSTQPVLCMARS